MTPPRYCLSEEGKKGLAQALKRLGLYKKTTKKYDRAKLYTLTGIDQRTTIRKILVQVEQPSELHALQLKKLTTFFEGIDRELKTRGYEELGLRGAKVPEQKYAAYIQEATFPANSNGSPISPVSSSPEHSSRPEEQLIELLWTLDCSKQQGDFTMSSGVLDVAGAFLVRAKDIKLEKWLVKRFARQIPGFGNAICHGIFVPSHPMRFNFNDFWEDLSRKFKATPKQESIINAIATRCETQTVILALYGIQKLNQEKVCQLTDFWNELVAEVRRRSRVFDARLVLFLTAEIGNQEYLKLFNPQQQSFPVILEPLDWIDSREVINWLALDEIKPTLIELIGEQGMNSLISDIRQCNPQQHPPLQPIQEICWACQLSLAHIEKSWELSA